MKALTCDRGVLSLRDIAPPHAGDGEALVRVSRAGICATDLEIVKGYMPNFNGVLGHEFFGHVEEARDRSLIGQRVTAEINAGCGACGQCRAGLQRHCPHRTVLGIARRNGCFAEYVAVPEENLIPIPDAVPDDAAVMIEPLAAALEIFEQVEVSAELQVLLVGDGRLAQLIARAFACRGFPLTVVGKYEEKLAHMEAAGAATVHLGRYTPAPFDLVIEASGTPSGLGLGLSSVKPRGTVVLKSTYAGEFPFNPSVLVVNEITLLGSRCGRFDDALRFLLNYRPDLSYMISARYPLSKAIEAFGKAGEKGVLKVLLEMA